MIANDEMTIGLLGKSETVIYPSIERAAGYTITALSFIGESFDGIRTRDWRVVDLMRDHQEYVYKVGVPPSHARSGPAIISALIQGTHALEQRTDKVPHHFNNAALKAMRDSLKVFGDGVAQVRLKSSVEIANPTKITSDHIKKLLAPVRHRHTSIRGRLYSVYVPEAKARELKVKMTDQNTGDAILCIVPRDQMPMATSCLDKRVAISGFVSYAITGSALQIEVEKIRPLEPIAYNDLPPLRLAGDEDTGEYVRRMRDAQ